jgi:hypothetical protein
LLLVSVESGRVAFEQPRQSIMDNPYRGVDLVQYTQESAQ